MSGISTTSTRKKCHNHNLEVAHDTYLVHITMKQTTDNEALAQHVKEMNEYALQHPVGTLPAEETRADGTKIRRYWTTDGYLWREEELKDGLYNGYTREWYSYGRLRSEFNYKDGEPNGVCRDWWGDGHPYYECNFKNGDKDGVQREWDVDGILTEKVYSHGYLISKV